MKVPLLRYPLQLPCVLAGLLLCGFALLLRLTWQVTAMIGDMGMALWLAFSGGAIVIFVWLALEYCLDMVEHSARGSEQAPGLRNPLRPGGSWDLPRAFKLVMLTALWAGTGYRLQQAELQTAAWLLWGCGLLLLPAALGQCALFDNLLQALNPLALLRCAMECGARYWLALLLLLPLTASLWLATTGSPLRFVSYLALSFYFLCLLGRVLGLGLRAYQTTLLQAVDFKTDARQLAGSSTSLQQLNKQLGAAHELLRAGRKDEAQQVLVAYLDAAHWDDFEQVFDYVSAWPFASAGVYIADRYLSVAARRQRFMRGLALLDWILSRQTDYAPSDLEALASLAQHAAVPAQYETVLRAVDNVLLRRPQCRLPDNLLHQALLLAGSRLQDEKRHAMLRGHFSRLDETHDGQ